jgi:purine-binding chemotaxis protein CheW
LNDYNTLLSETNLVEEDESQSRQYLIFSLGERYFGIETSACRQVSRVPEIVPLPEVPPHILGVINVRGQIVSVTSMAILMGFQQSPPSSGSRLVTISFNEKKTAILADSVQKIVEYSINEVHEVSRIEAGSEFAFAEVFTGTDLLLFLSPEKIFQSEKMVIDYRG